MQLVKTVFGRRKAKWEATCTDAAAAGSRVQVLRGLFLKRDPLQIAGGEEFVTNLFLFPGETTRCQNYNDTARIKSHTPQMASFYSVSCFDFYFRVFVHKRKDVVESQGERKVYFERFH